MNQYDRDDMAVSGLLDRYLLLGARRDEIKELAEATKKSQLCIVPLGGPCVWFRVAGELKKLSKRALVHRYLNPKQAPVFAQCSCKNKGCVHPDHQNVVDKKND